MPTEPHDPRAAVDALLATLDPLAYPDRMRTLTAWTQERLRAGTGSADGNGGTGDANGTGGAGGSAEAGAGTGAGSGGLRPLLDELDTRGTYGRRLAVVAAAIGQDAGFLGARLSDPDAVVRGHALAAAPHLPIGDAALERAMDDAPEAVRHRIAAAVVAGRRTALAERLLVSVRERWGDEEAARLLPGCGAEAVERLLPELFVAVVRWRGLACRHPDLVLDEVARQLADLPEQSRTAWWHRNADVFEASVEVRPLRVMDLLERHCPAQLPGPVRACLGPLLKAAPGRTIALLTAPARVAHRTHGLVSRTALGRVARRHPPELAALGRAWSRDPAALAQLLRALPPSGREAFYDAATTGQDLSRAVLADGVLEALPRARAHAEARRMAAQAAESGKPWDTVLAAVAHLPAAEARERLVAATRRPAAEDRAVAYPLLVRNASRSGEPEAVAVLLDDLQRLRNEQDPVRSAALRALADVPPRLFTAAGAGLLDRVAVDAIEARDSSHGTRYALSKLALALLSEHAVSGELALVSWALTTLTRLSGHTGGADLGRLDTTLRKGQEFQVFEALRPWLEAGADKVDHALTFALARSLGRRARHMPELQELLGQAVRFGNDATVRRAVDLWLDDPATRDERAALVVECEPSAAVLPPVLRVLTHRRTDLLDPLLADTPPYGRFLVAGAHWLPPVDAAGRWLPRQQAAAARLLARAAGDASLPKNVRAEAIREAATLPELGFAAVARHLDSADTVLAEAALASLAWTDRPGDALPLLLAHAGDDRARVAVYAAGRVSRFVVPSRLETALRAALLPAGDGRTAKVTSRKELVRLAATRLPFGTAAAILDEAFTLPDQHRDVQAACVPAATRLLRSPAAWRLLERAAAGPPAAQEAFLRVRPYDLRPAERARYARLVGQVSHSADPETADAATAVLARWAPWYPEASALLLAATTDLDNRSSWRAAADGLVHLAAAAGGADPLLDALTRLVAAESEAGARGTDAGERDRPARQRIAHLVSRLTSTMAVRRTPAHRATALRASELLCATPDFVTQGVHLAATALDLDAAAAPLCGALDHLESLHSGRPALAARTASTLYSRLTSSRRPGDPLALLAATDQLTLNGRYAAGLFAVSLTHAMGVRTGWAEDWRARLRALRRHPHPDVTDAALSVTTSVD